eukprot:c28467_g3_i2 orf=1039-3261(-)
MGSRLREDEKNEKIVRSLLKQNANRRCINCNSLGPQYVCLNFWTFVCTTCSGIHREFTHRVKSVSLSKFTAQEVSALQNGGNEHAREIYFKEWDAQRQPFPDSSNVDRLRDFIKSVYVDKRFSGERQPFRGRGVDRDDGYNARHSEPRMDYRTDSRSPPYEDRHEVHRVGGRRSDAGFDGRRSDERFGHLDGKRSPGRFETDKSRYDKGYNDNQHYEEHRRYEGRDRYNEDHYNEGLDKRFEERFVNGRWRSEGVQHRRGFSDGSPPPVRSVKEILGDDVPPLQVEDNIIPANGIREGERPQRLQDSRGQRFGSSSSFGSVDGIIPVFKRANSESLIDFSAEPDPAPVIKQPDPFGLLSAVQQTNTMSGTGWATFDTFSKPLAAMPAPEVSRGVNELSAQMNSTGQWSGQWASVQAAPPHPALSFGADGFSALGGHQPQVPVSIGGSNQAWDPFPISSTSNPMGPSETLQPQTLKSQVPPSAALSDTGLQAASFPNKQRQEIPEELFSSLISETSSPSMGMQITGALPFVPQFVAARGVGIPEQMSTYVQPLKSTNPFDFPDDPSSMSTESGFPHLSSLQMALPNMNVGPMSVHNPGLGHPRPQWLRPSMMVPPPASIPSAAQPNMMVSPPASIPSAALTGHSAGQHIPNGVLAVQSGLVGAGLGVGIAVAQDSLFPIQRPVKDGSFGSEFLFPALMGQHPPSQGALERLQNNALGSDSVWVQQLPAQRSLGSASGNPFG